MKPSKRIEELLKKEKVNLETATITDLFIIIGKIMQYLDEQWEKNKTPEQRQYDQIK